MPARARILAPSIEPLALPELDDLDADELVAHTAYDALRVADADVAGRDLSGISFTECELAGWSAHETSLRNARMLEVRVARLNAPVLLARRLHLREVEISDSRIGSAELYDSELAQVTVSNSKLGWVNLRAAQLSDVVFRNCRFDELDLGGAGIARVSFEDCTTDKLLLGGARAQHLDLRGLAIGAIDGVEALRGATISDVQLMYLSHLFAEHFGIRVKS